MMEHKAFLFDGDRFDEELRPLLEAALSTGNCTPLVHFIHSNLEDLADPFEGDPLPSDWGSMLEVNDAHAYGDFALTKYYDPTADIGLGALWGRLQELIAGDPGVVTSPILGTTIGPTGSPFDPGKMGSYFQDARQVEANLGRLLALTRQSSSDVVADAVRMLTQAMRAERGLYVTF